MRLNVASAKNDKNDKKIPEKVMFDTQLKNFCVMEKSCFVYDIFIHQFFVFWIIPSTLNVLTSRWVLALKLENIFEFIFE